jgi:hypothetical protein
MSLVRTARAEVINKIQVTTLTNGPTSVLLPGRREVGWREGIEDSAAIIAFLPRTLQKQR